MSEREQFSTQVERLAQSEVLHSSESLCRLLRYLARHSLDHPGVSLKEYQIATEVFGRPLDFDPQSDSAIRVQAGRLRAKLIEYYASEGAADPILVELPKGSYVLQFHRRASAGLPPHNGNSTVKTHTGAVFNVQDSAGSWKIAALALGIVCLVLLTVVGILLTSRSVISTALAGQNDLEPREFQQLWRAFISAPQAPWVIFSNAAFVGRPETGMRYYNSSRDSNSLIWDHYTGVGEVLAVHDLDEVFETFHHSLRVKRGSLFSLDDARNNNLIFLGSPSENLTLMEIPSTREFVFQRLADGPRKGDLAVVNSHPQRNEEKSYVASPSGLPLTDDYAVVGLMPGLDPARSVMILAGTTTFGTQAAVDYVSHWDSLKQFLSRLPISSDGQVEPFEALLHVRIVHGVPVSTDLISVRKR